MQARPQSLSTGRVVASQLLETHLARVLFSAQNHRTSGVLTVDEGPVLTRLHLRQGKVVYAERGSLGESLGRLLMREGLLDRSEYLVILEYMAKPSDRDEVLRFGEVAIQLGMLDNAELHAGLARQVRSKLEHCLTLDEAVWTWTGGVSPRRGATFPTPLEPAVAAALREAGIRWRNELWPLVDHTVRLIESPQALARRFEVPPEELRFLRGAEGRTVSELLRSPVLETNLAAALIVTLRFADRLYLEPPRARKPTTPPPPPTAVTPPDAQMQTARAREAAMRLREEMVRRRRAQPSTPKGRVDAERCYERGRDLLKRGLWARAKASFADAASQMPEAAEYVLHLRFCEWMAEEDPQQKAAHELELRAATLEALRQDRRIAIAHYLHGRLSLIDGDVDAAERAFELASKLDPQDLETQRYVRLLKARRVR